MTRIIGIGVIGMGWMGEVHSRSYRAVPDRFHESGLQPRLIVCTDAVEARAQAAQQRFGFERSTTDWRAVIADPKVEAISVTAPNGMHLEINRAAARAGKHILCEKPVGKDPQETIQSASAAREAGVLTAVGYNYRWAPLVQYARQLITVIEVYNFLHSVATGQQGQPGFAEALAVANVQQAIIRSWESQRWEDVER
jgi:predicted dehydrogenase